MEPNRRRTEVHVYDFRTANKFSKEQIRTPHFIYDNYANRLSTFLSGMPRAARGGSAVHRGADASELSTDVVAGGFHHQQPQGLSFPLPAIA